jgi:hypothetical protein
MSENKKDSWLIRTYEHHLTGPFSHEQMVEKLLNGDLDPGDETCHSGDHWIRLIEGEKIVQAFGIPARFQRNGSQDEPTETQSTTPSHETTLSSIDSAPAPEKGYHPAFNEGTGTGEDAFSKMSQRPNLSLLAILILAFLLIGIFLLQKI